MAPESIRNREYSRASDVWSLAVVITEILTRDIEPYADLQPIQVALKVAYEGLRPRVPDGASVMIAHVIDVCTRPIPADRAEIGDIVKLLAREVSVWA
jgi:serine/threonine protein kinase